MRPDITFTPGPDLRLATFNIPAVHTSLSVKSGLMPPAILVSYVFLESFKEHQPGYVIRDWMMDSGAYSAWNSGQVIDIDKYIDDCHRLRETDPTLKEIVGLDVIGDPVASRKNNFYMRDKGVDIVPVFHYGEPWSLLDDYCAAFTKVGLARGLAENTKQALWFYEQIFARTWPKRFHSFGWVTESVLNRFPFHSGDSTSWEIGPVAFGQWKTYGKMSVRGANQNLRSQIEWYLRLEARLRVRWSKEMKQLAELKPV